MSKLKERHRGYKVLLQNATPQTKQFGVLPAYICAAMVQLRGLKVARSRPVTAARGWARTVAARRAALCATWRARRRDSRRVSRLSGVFAFG